MYRRNNFTLLNRLPKYGGRNDAGNVRCCSVIRYYMNTNRRCLDNVLYPLTNGRKPLSQFPWITTLTIYCQTMTLRRLPSCNVSYCTLSLSLTHSPYHSMQSFSNLKLNRNEERERLRESEGKSSNYKTKVDKTNERDRSWPVTWSIVHRSFLIC